MKTPRPSRNKALRSRRDAEAQLQALRLRVAQLELKLEDTVELLHFWKAEACASYGFAEALASGEYPLENARVYLKDRLPQRLKRS